MAALAVRAASQALYLPRPSPARGNKSLWFFERLFYFEFPEKFKWGACRYVFLFLGTASFFQTYLSWKKVKHGEEGIPYGSMINGEEDAGGDMNGLHDGFGWSQHDIIYTYNHLADACVVALVVVYLVFVLRLNRLLARGWETRR
jgi:hypothetical protein